MQFLTTLGATMFSTFISLVTLALVIKLMMNTSKRNRKDADVGVSTVASPNHVGWSTTNSYPAPNVEAIVESPWK
jgi:hypothetical protein